MALLGGCRRADSGSTLASSSGRARSCSSTTCATARSKTRLQACLDEPPRRTAFSIGHRGAGLVFPEHTLEAYEAGFRMGAGTLECDVTFTKDLALVCRHSQNDLATTTDILLTPLASTCIEPFTPARLDANGAVRAPARAECRTSELTLGRVQVAARQGRCVRSGRADRRAVRRAARAARGRISAPASSAARLLTHAESIALFQRLGVRMTPELEGAERRAAVQRPHARPARPEAHRRISRRGCPAERRLPQSFDRRDVEYWIEHEPEFGERAVLLDDTGLPVGAPRARRLKRYKAAGINIWAPPLFVLLDLDAEGRIVPSRAARAARAAGLDIIAWTLERSGNLAAPNNGFYYRTIDAAITREGDVMQVIDVLVRDVGVRGIFSDWPATVSFYAGCAGLP